MALYVARLAPLLVRRAALAKDLLRACEALGSGDLEPVPETVPDSLGVLVPLTVAVGVGVGVALPVPVGDAEGDSVPCGRAESTSKETNSKRRIQPHAFLF